jgi:hypothetical protein
MPTEDAKKEAGLESPEEKLKEVHGGKKDQTTGGADDDLD